MVLLLCVACSKEFKPKNQKQRACCKKCAHKAKPKHHKRFDLWRNYKITQDDWNKLFEAQGGCCKICLRHQSQFKKALFTDHDHKTNRVRGLLCSNCNFAIGLLNDDPALFLKASEYLTNAG